MSSKKERALRQAKREFGIEIDEVFYPDYLGKFPEIKINIGDDFEEDQLEEMQKNLMKALGHASGYYSMIKQNDKIKWLVGSIGKDRVFHYDYQDVLDSLNMAKAEFLEKKENSEIKDYEIHSIYWHLQNVGATSVDDQKFTYEVLENGDLVLAESDAVEKERMQYQGYLIKMK